MPNIIEQQEQIMGLSREALVNYAQNPSGALPLYLVLERIRDLTQQEKKYLASQDQPQGTIFDQSLAEASPSPQGIGELQPQMPIGASGGAMPPSNAMQQPQMPPEMMSAQMASAAPQPQMMAARGGRMPYRRMAGGGPIPGSIMEDASKFSPESLYDVGPMQQSAMANATNMGIPSVLPMAGGGVVKMEAGRQTPFVSMRDLPGGMTREKFQVLSQEEQDLYLQTIRDKEAFLRGPGGIRSLAVAPSYVYDKFVLNPLKATGELASRALRGLGAIDPTEETFLEGGRYNDMTSRAMGLFEDASGIEEYLSATPEISPLVDPRNKLEGPPEPDLMGDETSNYEEIVSNLENEGIQPPGDPTVVAPDSDVEVIGAPDVPVLQTGEVTPDAVGVREIPGLSDLVTPDQDTELKTARERLTGLMGQEVEPYDPTELLLKSQERADQRAINQALINFGAGIARGDAASGLEKAGESVASIKDRQELLEQQLQTRRGEAQVQAQKDQIARDIAIAEADIGAIESDKDYQDKLIARQIQYEGLLLDARTADNDAAIKQFTAKLAANNFLQGQSEFNRTLAANLNEQEQLNYRAQLTTLNNAFEVVSSEIIRRNMYAPEEGQDAPSWPEIEKELEDARVRIFGQIVALKEKGTDWKLPEDLSNIGGVSLVQGDDGVYRIGN